ncbi:MAG: Hsp70 family protein [Proteobacteria bacterium]|nr:Hsp70 family protein [Pseudomonadota bacterium]
MTDSRDRAMGKQARRSRPLASRPPAIVPPARGRSNRLESPIIGIDLGTTNSVVAIADEAGEVQVLPDHKGFKIQPSVVAFHPNSSVVVGAEAKQRRIIDAENTVYSAKRLIGRTFNSPEVTAAAVRLPYAIGQGQNRQPVISTRGGELAIPEISAMVLDHMRKLAERHLSKLGQLDHPIDRAVITVPANFTDAQRTATSNAGAIAGLSIPQVLNEPTAAALAYGHKRPLDRVIAVYDFGGGTFDVTVLRLAHKVYEVQGTAGNSFLGGDDIDERVVDTMVELFLQKERIDLRGDHIAMQRLRQVAEQIKVELSRRQRAIVTIDTIAYGPGGKPINMQLEMTREQLISHAAEVVDRTFPVCEEALRLAGLKPRDIDDVVLVGGSTKMPYVRQRVGQYFDKKPRTDINPDEAVAVGAALQGMALRRILGPSKQSVAPRPTTARPGAGRTGTARPAIAAGAKADPRRPVPPRPPSEFEKAETLVSPQSDGPSARIGDLATADTAQIELPEASTTGRLGRPIAPAPQPRKPGVGLPPPIPRAAISRRQVAEELDLVTPETGKIARTSRQTMRSGVHAGHSGRTADPSIELAAPQPDLAIPPSGRSARLRGAAKAPAAKPQDSSIVDSGNIAPKNFDSAESKVEPDRFGLERSDRADEERDGDGNQAAPEDSSAGDGSFDGSIELDLRALDVGKSSSDFEAEEDTSVRASAGRAPSSDSAGSASLPPPELPGTGSDGGIDLDLSKMGLPPPQPASNPLPAARMAMDSSPSQPLTGTDSGNEAEHHVPLVLDVVPHSLGIGTVAGYCEGLIHRNSRLPSQMKRVFTTSKDLQRTVRISVCQGESRRLDQNVLLGDLVLEDLEPRPRGQTEIEVTFEIDVSGILHVRACDSATGIEQEAYLNVFGTQSAEELRVASDRFHEMRG